MDAIQCGSTWRAFKTITGAAVCLWFEESIDEFKVLSANNFVVNAWKISSVDMRAVKMTTASSKGNLPHCTESSQMRRSGITLQILFDGAATFCRRT